MKKRISSFIYYFILLQPFLDLSIFYHGWLANTVPFTLPTIIRVAALIVLICMFLSEKQNWRLKKNKWLLLYLLLFIIYSGAHLFHNQHFYSISSSSYGYSAAGEAFYLLRLLLPLLLIFFTFYSDFRSQQFQKVIYCLSTFFSSVIVLTNLLQISLRSYGNGLISKNIFFWYDQSIGYSHLASKGWFNFANMVSAVLLMLLPLLLYYLTISFSGKNMLITSLHALAMIMLGTKVALFGLILALVLNFVVWLFHCFILKNATFNKKAALFLGAIFLIALALTPISPTLQRYRYEQYLAQHSNKNTASLTRKLKTNLTRKNGSTQKAYAQKFVGDHYQDYSLNKRFVVKSYPYQRDPLFWTQIMQLPGQTRLKNRYLEKAMLDKVVATNNNHWDRFLGIGFMRQTHIFNLERDFTAQTYSLGILGSTLLLGPYLIILLMGIVYWLKKKDFRIYLHSSLLLAISYLLLAAFSSGNVIDFPTANLILAFTEGFLLIEIKKETSSH